MHRAQDLLFYHTPANDWNSALPLGNGKLGAMVYGRVLHERIDLNYDELWSGYPREDTHPYIRDALRDASRLTLDGRQVEAEALLTPLVGEHDVEEYLPFGSLLLDFFHDGVTDYERSLDLADAVCRTFYRVDGASYKREVFASHPDQALLVRLTAEDGGLSFKATFSSPMRYALSAADGMLVFDGECIANSAYNREKDRRRDFFYSPKDEERGILYRGALGVKTDGRVRLSDKLLTVENASEAILVFSAESSFNGYDRHPFLDGKEYKSVPLARVKALLREDYATLLRRHVEDYTALFHRSSLTLGANMTNIPTDARLVKTASEDSLPPSLAALLLNFAKYLTIAASRKGSEAMHLQGIWNHLVDPKWASDYTTNINVEMNYFPTLALGLFSCYEPLLRLTEELAVTGRKTAKRMYGARGFTVHHNTDLWRKTTPATGRMRWTYFPAASGWLASMSADYARYTGDNIYLKEKAFPILKEACLFYLDMLEESPEGVLVMTPATSPENSYLTDGGDTAVSYTAAMANDIVARVFDDLIYAADTLGEEDETVRAVRKARPRLLPPRVRADGRLMEWYDERELSDPHHRHISHLYALYPARLITRRETPALAEACRLSLDARGDEGTGWSLAWKLCCRAMLGDGEHAERLLKMQLRPAARGFEVSMTGGGTYPNLFDAHPPFQIDGNFGVAAGIVEMLVSYDRENIYLLPALPASWEKGSLEGFVTPHGTVSCSWENGKLTSYSVENKKEGISLFAMGKKL